MYTVDTYEFLKNDYGHIIISKPGRLNSDDP